MFQKILIANRGEIAVRIARTCREMNIPSAAVYELPDQTSLHIRVADECALLESPRGFQDQAALLQIARAVGADAIHPGYGFLAENTEFIRRCQQEGITFIGPPVAVVEQALAKIDTLSLVRNAGINTVICSSACMSETDAASLRDQAARLGYPVIVKSCRGGRGRGERVVHSPEHLPEAIHRAQAESQTVYGDTRIFLEKAISPAHQVGVQILADAFGNVVHLGECEGSLLHGNQKVLEESPAPCCTDAQRARLWQTALEIARLLKLRGVLTVEFLADAAGEFYFTEVKPRIQIEHPLTEMRARMDLVRAQIQLAAGMSLDIQQRDVVLQGHAMACRINAQDPQQNFIPSPGRVRVRFPNGPETRTDTYVYSGCVVPAAYDPLIAKLNVWGPDRAQCLARLRRALHEISLQAISTTAPWLEQLASSPEFASGIYSTATSTRPRPVTDPQELQDLAIAAALLYARANEMVEPITPARFAGNWHRAARELPQ